MSISCQSVREFLTQVATTVPDRLDCDGCFALMAELADADRRGVPLSAALAAVQTHLTQCVCCAYEYETLLEALRAAEEPTGGTNGLPRDP